MDIMDKAKELGQMIADSEQNKRVITAEIMQTNDDEAQVLLRQYNEKRKEITNRVKVEQPSSEELKSFKDELQKEFDILLENKKIKEYIDAKNEFDKLMQSVNSIIAYYITGEEQSDCSSGKCGSCSGCH